MKKLMILAALAVGSAMAAEWTGYIIDKDCSGKKDKLGDVACAKACIKRGSPAVLVTDDGTVLSIADQDKVTEYAEESYNHRRTRRRRHQSRKCEVARSGRRFRLPLEKSGNAGGLAAGSLILDHARPSQSWEDIGPPSLAVRPASHV